MTELPPTLAARDAGQPALEPEPRPSWWLIALETWLRVPELLARAWRGERVRIAAAGQTAAVLISAADLERLRELDRRDAAEAGAE